MPFLDEAPPSSSQGGGRFLDEPESASGGGTFLGAGRDQTPDEIHARLASETNPTVTRKDAETLYAAQQARPVSDQVRGAVGGALDAIPHVIGSLGKSIGEGAAQAYGAYMDQGRAAAEVGAGLGLSAAEGVGRGTLDLGEQFRRGKQRASDASVPANVKRLQMALAMNAPEGAAIPQPTVDPVEQFQKRLQSNVTWDRMRQQMSTGEQGGWIDPSGQMTQNGMLYPGVSDATANVADATAFVPGAELLAKGAVKTLGMEALGKTIAEKTAQKLAFSKGTGKAADILDKGYELAKLPGSVSSKIAEGVAPETGLANEARGIVNIGMAPVLATTKNASRLARVLQEVSRTTGDSSLGRFEQLAASPTAPEWIRTSARTLALTKAEDVVKVIRKAGASVGMGATLGAAIGAPGAETPEEAGAAVGSGATLGGLTHVILAHAGTAQERQIAEAYDVACMWSQKTPEEHAAIAGAAKPWSPKAFLELASAEATMNGVLDPNSVVQFKVVPQKEFTTVSGGNGATRAFATFGGDKPTILINADRFAEGTAWHELGHAFMAAKGVMDAAAVTQRLFGIYDQSGKQVSPGMLPDGQFIERGNQYIDRFPAGSPARQSMETMRNAYVQDPGSPEGSAWMKLVGGEVVSELFANLARSTEGNLFEKTIAPGQTAIDKALLAGTTPHDNTVLGRALNTVGSLAGPTLNKVGGVLDKLTNGPRRESDIFPGLQNTPQVDALLRQQIRNRYKGEGFPEFSTDQPTKSINPRELRKGGVLAAYAAKEFGSVNDNFVKNPDGTPLMGAGGEPILRNTEREIQALQTERAKRMRETWLKIAPTDPEATRPGIMRPVMNPDGTPSDHWEGTWVSKAQLDSLRGIDANLLPPKLIENLETLNNGGAGQIFYINYNPALKSKRYQSSLSRQDRLAALRGFAVSDAGNINARIVDVTAMNAKLANWLHTPSKARAFVDFNNDPNAFMQAVHKVLDNHAARVEGATGLDSDPAKARRMAERVFDFINIRDLDSEGLIADRISAREGKQGEKDKLIKSLRLDRMNDVKVQPNEKFSIDYQLQKAAFSPDAPKRPPTPEELREWRVSKEEWVKLSPQDQADYINQAEAEKYFSIGHSDPESPNPGAKAWVWRYGNLQVQPGSVTHGMGWGHHYERFKGRYDAQQNVISFVDDKQEVKSEDDLPQQVYKALKSKFPADAKIIFFSPEGEKEANKAVVDNADLQRAGPDQIEQRRAALTAASARQTKESGQYSALEQVINDKIQGASIPAAQLAAMLRNPQSGVKAEEIKWTGLDDFLKGRERVTKQEVLDFVRANRLQIEEKRLGEDSRSEAPPKWDEFLSTEGGKGATLFQNGGEGIRLGGIVPQGPKAPGFKASVTDGGETKIFPTYDEAKYWVLNHPIVQEKLSTGEKEPTKYDQYKSPGGENYREILFRFPDTSQVENGPSDHWQDNRVFAHTRVQDYSDAGKKTLLIDEIQSDWHQKGRKEGYIQADPELDRIKQETERLNSRARELGDQIEKFVDASGLLIEPSEIRRNCKVIADRASTDWMPEINRRLSLWGGMSRSIGITPNDLTPLKSQMSELVRVTSAQRATDQALTRREQEQRGKVPEAPFAKTWHEFVFKRMLRDAVEKGYDAVEWPDGATIAKRFDLSQHVESLGYEKRGDGWILYPDEGDRIPVEDVDLENHVGEAVAQRIRNGEGTEHEVSTEWAEEDGDPVLYAGENEIGRIVENEREENDDENYRVLDSGGDSLETFESLAAAKRFLVRHAEKNLNVENRKILSGDIELGSGESRGMKQFYDNMLPAFVNKYVKKWGGKVEDTVRGESSFRWESDDNSGPWYYDDPANNIAHNLVKISKRGSEFEVFRGSEYLGTEKTLDAAKRLAEEGSGTKFPVHRVEITQLMRQEISAKGQTLFSPDAPETIRSAAIRTKDGSVFEARAHFGAAQKATLAGKTWHDEDAGFVTSGGRFVSREEAEMIALRAKQLKANILDPQMLHADDFQWMQGKYKR